MRWIIIYLTPARRGWAAFSRPLASLRRLDTTEMPRDSREQPLLQRPRAPARQPQLARRLTLRQPLCEAHPEIPGQLQGQLRDARPSELHPFRLLLALAWWVFEGVWPAARELGRPCSQSFFSPL